MSWLIGPQGILDPTRWCIIAVGMFSNGGIVRRGGDAGLSAGSSPSPTMWRAQSPSRHGNGRVDKLAPFMDFDGRHAGLSLGGASTPKWWNAPSSSAAAPARRSSTRFFLSGLLRTLEAAPEHTGNGRFSERAGAGA